MKSIKFLFPFIMMVLFTSCGFHSVDNGNVGIVIDTFSQNVHDNVLTSGLTLKPFVSVQEVDATDVRLEIKDLQPKDKKGMKFEDVDLTVTVRLKKDKAIELYKETKEIDEVAHNDASVLGYNKLVRLISSITTKAFEAYEYQEFMNNKSIIESKIKELAVAEIKSLMYDAYEVKDVATTVINLMPDIEKSFQNRSLVAQKELLVQSKEKLMLKEMDLKQKEMKRLKQISDSVGIKVTDLMEFQIQNERNEVLSDLSKGSGQQVLLQVDKK